MTKYRQESPRWYNLCQGAEIVFVDEIHEYNSDLMFSTDWDLIFPDRDGKLLVKHRMNARTMYAALKLTEWPNRYVEVH